MARPRKTKLEELYGLTEEDFRDLAEVFRPYDEWRDAHSDQLGRQVVGEPNEEYKALQEEQRVIGDQCLGQYLIVRGRIGRRIGANLHVGGGTLIKPTVGYGNMVVDVFPYQWYPTEQDAREHGGCGRRGRDEKPLWFCDGHDETAPAGLVKIHGKPK